MCCLAQNAPISLRQWLLSHPSDMSTMRFQGSAVRRTSYGPGPYGLGPYGPLGPYWPLGPYTPSIEFNQFY